MENIREAFYADKSDYYQQLFAEMKNGSRKSPVLLQQRGAGLVDGLARLAIPVLVTEKRGERPKSMLAIVHTEKPKKKATKRKLPEKPALPLIKPKRRQKGKGFQFPLFM